MTASNHKKILNQIGHKSGKVKKYKKHNTKKDRSYGRTVHKCSRCGRNRGVIKKYNLNLCRQCLREVHNEIGFIQYS